MDTHNKGVFALSIVTVLLAGCGGGGGGSSSATLGGFTTWPNFTSGSVSLTGQAQEASEEGAGFETTISVPTHPLSATYNQTKNTSSATTALTVSTSNGTKDMFDTDTTTLVAIDPSAYGYDYQTYGVWSYVTPALMREYGVFSVGSATPSSAIPTSGTATYSGMMGGHLINTWSSSPLGFHFTFSDWYRFLSDLSVSANFGTRSLGVTTSNSIIEIPPGLLLEAATNNINMTGTLTYAAGSNSFSGTLTTGDGLSGTASGKFYGPAAEELGGTVAMQSGGTTLLGAFGAKR